MEFRIDFYPGTPEAAIIGEAIIKLGAIRTGQKDQDEKPEPSTGMGVLGVGTLPAGITEVKAETTAPVKRTRTKKEAVLAAEAEVVKAVIGLDPAADLPAPSAPAVQVVTPAEQATPAKRVWTVKELEDKVRAMAHSDFDKMFALLTEYKVPRFGVLPVEKHQEFGDKLMAL